MRWQPGALVALLTSLALVGCGSDNNDNKDANSPPAMQPAAQRGDLLLNPPTKLNSYTPADLLAALGNNDIGKALVSLAISPVCTVDVYQLQYQTVGAKAESATASGA